MADEDNRFDAPKRFRFASSAVRPDPKGGWITDIQLYPGASVSRWFEQWADAQRYPAELAEWLSSGSD